MKLRLIATTAVFAITAASGAAAQAQTGQSAAAAPAEQTPALEEVVVTAQRREESLQKAAVAVTAVSAAQIQRAGVTEVTQLSRVAPSLQIGNVGGPINAFFLRGVGNFTTNALSDSAIAVNLDGVYLGRPTSVQGIFFDLQRVEVLKGPQGTLYGRNATGGAINVITNKPDIGGGFSGDVNLEFGNFASKKADAAVNVPIDDHSALRIAGQVISRDGNYSDGTGDEKLQSARIQYANKLNDTVKITAGFDFTHQGGIGSGATIHGLDKNERIGLLDPRAVAVYNSTFVFLAGNTLPGVPSDIYNDNKFWGFYAQADIDTPLGTLTLLPAYRKSSLNYRTISPGFPLTEQQDGNQTSFETRLVSHPGGPLSYIAGIYYLHENDDEFASFDQQFFAAYAHFVPKTDSIATYGRVTYSVTDQFRLTGGLRWTQDKKSADINAVNAVVVCPGGLAPPPAVPHFCFGGPSLPPTLTTPSFLLTPTGGLIPVQPFGTTGNIVTASQAPISPSKTWARVTYRVGAEYDVAPNSMLYATYETGFKSGGFYQSIDNPTFQPETIEAITVGSKNRFLSNRLQVNLEAFHWKYNKQQISHFRTNSQGGTEFVTENIGETKLQGVELETQAAVTADTILNATIQYLDAQDTSYIYNNPANLGPPVTGCPFGPTTITTSTGAHIPGFAVNCSGFTPPMSPKWSITAGVEQHFDLGEAGELVFNAQSRFQSRMGTGIDLQPQETQKSYVMTDLQLRYTPKDGRFNVAAFVNNLEDRNVTAFSTVHPRAGSLILDHLSAPRTYGVRLGAKF